MTSYTFYEHFRDPRYLNMMAAALTAAAFIGASETYFGHNTNGRFLSLFSPNECNLHLTDKSFVAGSVFVEGIYKFEFDKKGTLDGVYQLCTSGYSRTSLTDWLKGKPPEEGRAIIASMLRSTRRLLLRMSAMNLKISDANLAYLTLLNAFCVTSVSVYACYFEADGSLKEVVLSVKPAKRGQSEVRLRLQANPEGLGEPELFGTRSIRVLEMSGLGQSYSSAADLLGHVSEQGVPLKFDMNTTTDDTLQAEKSTSFCSR